MGQPIEEPIPRLCSRGHFGDFTVGRMLEPVGATTVVRENGPKEPVIFEVVTPDQERHPIDVSLDFTLYLVG